MLGLPDINSPRTLHFDWTSQVTSVQAALLQFSYLTLQQLLKAYLVNPLYMAFIDIYFCICLVTAREFSLVFLHEYTTSAFKEQ